MKDADEVTLWTGRVMLCDLLQGRIFRKYAQAEFEAALSVELLGAPRFAVTDILERAVHREWIASIAEKGQVLWGGRYDRERRLPEDSR